MKRKILSVLLTVAVVSGMILPCLALAQEATYASTEYQVAYKLKADGKPLPRTALPMLASRNVVGLASVLSSDDWTSQSLEVFAENHSDVIVVREGFDGVIRDLTILHALSGSFVAVQVTPLAFGEPLWTTYEMLDAALSCKLIQVFNQDLCSKVVPKKR